MKTFETFKPVNDYLISGLTSKEPSCFNGKVMVKKYRITIEEIHEPDWVIKERIQDMWDKCDNPHHTKPLRLAADKLGLKL